MAKRPPKSEIDIFLLAIAKEKESYAHLAAAARACTCPKARRLYNQLALDELKHLLTLVSVMDGLADDCLAQIDLTFPVEHLPDPLPRSEESILQSTAAEAQSQQLFTQLAEGVDREELRPCSISFARKRKIICRACAPCITGWRRIGRWWPSGCDPFAAWSQQAICTGSGRDARPRVSSVLGLAKRDEGGAT